MAEASETQAWLDFAVSLGYISQETYEELDEHWQRIGGMLYKMVVKADSFSGQYTRRYS